MKIWNITKSTKSFWHTAPSLFLCCFFLSRLKAAKHRPELDPKGPVLWVDQRSSRPNWTRCPSQRKAAALFDAGSESERPTCPWWKEWIDINIELLQDATKCIKMLQICRTVELDSKLKQQRRQQQKITKTQKHIGISEQELLQDATKCIKMLQICRTVELDSKLKQQRRQQQKITKTQKHIGISEHRNRIPHWHWNYTSTDQSDSRDFTSLGGFANNKSLDNTVGSSKRYAKKIAKP